MSYVSLYRKYRSQSFEDVMGQDHVTKTLQNAVRLGKVAHAYLFCGTRGTGKTTTARLLAKALNCEKGPTPQPCNECSACRSITEGSTMDIVEMDAASHRGVGDVKDIRENVKFPPMELRYKVYIIDEAHQLSNDAKDAFLKTLEEPPAHAIFILATTEPQNIPITIRSRCQQFEFRRGSLRDICGRLKHVIDSEGVEAEDAALDQMAVSADGSWRDALSLLEQVLAYTDGKVTLEDVNTVLGMVTQDFLFQLADALADADEPGAFAAAAEVVESGRDIQLLLSSIAQHFRNLLFASVTNRLDDLTTSEELGSRMKDQAAKFSKSALLRGVEIFSQAERDVRQSDQHRLLLELALLKAIEAMHPSQQAAQPAPVTRPAPPAQTRPESVQVPAEPRKQATKPGAETPSPAPQPEPEEPVRKPAKSDAPAAPSGQQQLPEFDRIVSKWNQVLQHVRTISMPAHGLLKDVKPTGVRGGSLVLEFRYEAHKKMITDGVEKGGNPKTKALLAAIERTFGVPNVGLICEVVEEQRPVQPQSADDEDLPDPFDASAPPDPGQDTLQNVLDIFNGTIVDDD